jgi:hypothetical protein
MANIPAKVLRCQQLMERAQRARQVMDNARRDMNRAVAHLTEAEVEEFNKTRGGSPSLVWYEDHGASVSDRSFGDCLA